MPARIPQLPRFTLYTGPTCSLCDTAKAALAQVRKTRPFDLQLVNIQDPGQERWRKKYVYWIPALHLEEKEVLKGRWGGERGAEGSGRMGQGEEQRGEQVAGELGSGPNGWMFWPDGYGMRLDEVDWRVSTKWCEHIFERVGDSDVGLGDILEKVENGSSGLSRCFNCGSPEHPVRSCPDPPNHALIALSRALFQFHRQSNVDDAERFHVSEDWKLQRRRWLDDFEPGQVRGELLQDALGLSEGEDAPWLYNMLEWGYPPGWAGIEDPRELVLDMIVSGKETDIETDLGEFSIFGEGEEKEILSLRPDPTSQIPAATQTNSECCARTSVHQHLQDSPVEPEGKIPASAPSVVRRWATYQTSLFSSELLPVYSGRPLPPLHDGVPCSSATAFAEKAQNVDPTNIRIGHPWRHPDAFSAFGPVDWIKKYERVLAHRSQVEKAHLGKHSDKTLARSRTLALDSESAADGVPFASSPTSSITEEANAGVEEDDMDLSD